MAAADRLGAASRWRSAAADLSPFTARLRGVGSFPSAKRGARALGRVRRHRPASRRLAAEIEAALADEFPAETRAFHPHLTVARSDPPLKLPAAYSDTELESDEWEVGHLVLFRSHLGRPAPRYEPLARFPLASVMLAFEHLFD